MEKLLWPRVINRENLNLEKCEIVKDCTPWQQLPVEILIAIFSSLAKKDLISLSLVCRRFNEVISEDRELLKRFTLHLNKRTVKSPWIGSRRYSRAKVMLCEFYGDFYYHQYLAWVDFTPPSTSQLCLFFRTSLHLQLRDFKKILNIQCTHLTHLTIIYPNVTLNPLKSLLVECPNLKFLEIFQRSEILEAKKFFLNPLPQLHLEELRLSCHLCTIINLLMNCQVKKFYLNVKHISYCCELSFKRFQQKQNEMKVEISPQMPPSVCENGMLNVELLIRSYNDLNKLNYWHYWRNLSFLTYFLNLKMIVLIKKEKKLLKFEI